MKIHTKMILSQMFLVQQPQLRDIDQKLQMLIEQVAVLNNNRYRFAPMKVEIEEYPVGVYKSKRDNYFKKANWVILV